MNNGANKGIFYGVVGVATLVVAIVGATFAYYMISDVNSDTVKGGSASINVSLDVNKVTDIDNKTGGLIPLSNSMVEVAINPKTRSGNTICMDDNGNAVCQIYRIVLINNSSMNVMVDGYLSLAGPNNAVNSSNDLEYKGNNNVTTMRWSQAFCETDNSGMIKNCTTKGSQLQNRASNGTGIDYGSSDVYSSYDSIDNKEDKTGFNKKNILVNYGDIVINKNYNNGRSYNVINKNYIRVSDGTKNPSDEVVFDQKRDITSALVINQNIEASSKNKVTSSTYYVVVWLSETGVNQNTKSSDNLFKGVVKFSSSQGNEVSATFSGYSS